MRQQDGSLPSGLCARLAVVAALVVFTNVRPACAGNLDVELLKQAPEVLGELKKRDYRNVGVLPFQVKKDGLPSFVSAPLAAHLPGRLENALILCQSPKNDQPLGIIRDAAGEASRAGVGAWTRTNFSYKALFNTRYPLAWGNERVRPDAFLSGTVTVLPGRKAVQVVVHLFDRSSRSGGIIRMDTVADFEVDIDRPLLRDLGEGYALSPDAVRRGVTARKRDAWALDEKEEDEVKPSRSGRLVPVTPDNVAGVAFEIRYNGKKQTIRPLSSAGGGREWQVDPVPAGARISFVLTRVLRDRRDLGVVVKLNGQSLWKFQTEDGLRCGKWIYGPDWIGIRDEITGVWIQKDGKNLKPFEVLTAMEAAAKAAELGEKAGWIDIDVYATGDGKKPEETDGREVTVTTRGLARSRMSFKDFATLHQELLRANNLRPSNARARSAGGLIVAAPVAVTGAPVLDGSLPNPIHMGGISIKYWDRRNRRIAD